MRFTRLTINKSAVTMHHNSQNQNCKQKHWQYIITSSWTWTQKVKVTNSKYTIYKITLHTIRIPQNQTKQRHDYDNVHCMHNLYEFRFARATCWREILT